MKIYTVQNPNGDTFGVYSNLEEVLFDLRSFYGPPYIVNWRDLVRIWQGFSQVGDFEFVEGWSSRHSKEFIIREWILDETWSQRKKRYADSNT